MTNEERKKIEEEINELQKMLNEEDMKKEDKEIIEVEEKWLGRCFIDKKGENYYRIISALTTECPYQLWAIKFTPNIKLSITNVLRLKMSPRDRFDFTFNFNPIHIVKIGNNYMSNPSKSLKEISEKDFFEAYETLNENLKKELKKTFKYNDIKK